ncbi:MAG: tRNA lysidine(34) synthetase TilS [Anaerolinea sp.]|nr:tRNA lysidine(34) synthetase TilS [Anaerolinea sp.]
MPLQTSVFQVIQRHALIPPKSTVVVGVSGGADSLALLHVLSALRDRLEMRLHAATLDHGLRGDAGADDARYVESLCALWNVPCTHGFADVPTLMRAGKLGVEAAARQARYDFLAEIARQQGARMVATAHHADDQAETVLLHLLRGTGLRGLSGMSMSAPMPDHPGVMLVRPLLTVTRADIEAYCAEHGIQPRHDATNDDLDYTRNRIRAEVLPILRRINPQISRSLVQLADIAAEEDAYLQAELDELIDGFVWKRGDRLTIPRDVFAGVPVALKRRLLLWAAGQLDSETGYEHVISALDILEDGVLGTIALLPNGVRLRVDYDEIVIEPQDAPIPPETPQIAEAFDVAVPGQTRLGGGWVLKVSNAAVESAHARLAIPPLAAVRLRPRKRGDRFTPLGLGGHTQKLSEWMVDHKVPRALRDTLPLLTVDGEIAAIVWGEQWTISERFAVKLDSTFITYYVIEKIHEI